MSLTNRPAGRSTRTRILVTRTTMPSTPPSRTDTDHPGTAAGRLKRSLQIPVNSQLNIYLVEKANFATMFTATALNSKIRK